MNNLKKEDAAHEGATQIYVYNNMGENSIILSSPSFPSVFWGPEQSSR